MIVFEVKYGVNNVRTHVVGEIVKCIMSDDFETLLKELKDYGIEISSITSINTICYVDDRNK